MHFDHSICIFFHHQNPVSMLVKSLRPIVYATYFYYLFFLFEIRYSKQTQFDILSRTVVGNQCNLNYNATSIRFRIMRNRSPSFSIFLPLDGMNIPISRSSPCKSLYISSRNSSKSVSISVVNLTRGSSILSGSCAPFLGTTVPRNAHSFQT